MLEELEMYLIFLKKAFAEYRDQLVEEGSYTSIKPFKGMNKIKRGRKGGYYGRHIKWCRRFRQEISVTESRINNLQRAKRMINFASK